MSERVGMKSVSTMSDRKRGMFGMLAGVLLASTLAVGAPVALPSVQAAADDYSAELAIIDGYPTTGAGSFDGTTASPVPALTTNAGTDANGTNDVVRVGDITTYNWSVTLNDEIGRPDPPPLDDLIFEQIITPADGANLEVTIDLTQCEGTSPSSQVLYDTPASGQITVRCNIGLVQGTGEQIIIEVNVKATLDSPNGSNFSSAQRVYRALDNDPGQVDPQVTPGSDGSPIDPIYITASPKWDIAKSNSSQSLTARTFNGVADTPGYDIAYDIRIQSPSPGSSALAQPISVDDSMTFLKSIAPLSDYTGDFQIVGCAAPDGNYPGACVFTPGVLSSAGGQEAQLTFSGIDFSGGQWNPQIPGPFLSGYFRVTVFVPMATIDMSDGVIDNAGAAYITNQINDFDPLDVTGVSNYNAGFEPGHCAVSAAVDGCTLMPNGTRSNNVTDNNGQLYNFATGDAGTNGAKYYFRQVDSSGEYSGLPPGQTNLHTYDGYQQPGSYHTARTQMYNSGLTRLDNPRVCDVFDNTMVSMVTAAAAGTTGLPPNTYAWAGNGYNGGIAMANWIVEYGHIAIAGDDPLDGPLNVVNNRYQGDWTSQAAARCTDGATVDGWKTDPTLVDDGTITGVDAVNAVRIRVADPADPAQQWRRDTYVTLSVPFQTRSTFSGGPNDGTNLPYGSVIANYGSTYTDQWGAWFAGSFNPFDPILNNGGGLGDRLTIAPTYLAVKKYTVNTSTTLGPSKGGSAVDSNGTATAGDPVVWELLPGAFSPFPNPAPVQLLMTDVLEPFQTYDAACTAALNPGLIAPTVDYNTNQGVIGAAPGYTTLRWDLGFFLPNPETPAPAVTTFPRVKVCVLSDSLAPANSNLMNNVWLASPQVPDTEYDSHLVTVGQPSRLRVKKTVDAPLDPTNDDQVWTLFAKNFSSLPIKTPTIIDVLPWNGDSASTPATGSVSRVPASNFHGAYGLAGPAVVQWNDGSAIASPYVSSYSADLPNTINQDARVNTSTWCTYAVGVFTPASGPGACPATFGDVTAVKVALGFNFAKKTDVVKSGVKITLNAVAGDQIDPFSSLANKAGDIYTNRFVLTSPSFSKQRVISNSVNVRVVGFSLGDLVFNDANGDGNWDAGEGTAPAGVTINLYDDTTGNLIGSTVTDAQGRYLFTSLPAGEYLVQIPATDFQPGGVLAGWEITPGSQSAGADVNGNDAVDHDGSTSPGGVTVDGITSSVITLSYHLAGTSPVGDEPIADNTNGLIDLNDDRLTNFTLDLAIIGPPAITITKDVCKDGSGVNCDLTNNTHWAPLFAVVPASSLAVWRITVTNTGRQTLDPVTVTDVLVAGCDALALGELKPTESYSYVCTGHVVTVSETPAAPFVNEATATGTPVVGPGVTDTDDAKIAALPTSPGVGDYVWYDTNFDGIQDPGESGVNNVIVELLDSNGDVVATTTTDASGFYAIFLTVDGDPLTPGVDYRVRFTPPAGYFPTLTGVGGDTTDSDGLLTDVFQLGATEYNPTLDLGLVQPSSLGNFVWYDLDHDGLQTPGEPGVPGVTVTLLDASGNLVTTDINGAPIVPMQTNALGFYSFTNLVPGDFRVAFSTLPIGTLPTISNAGDGTLDSDGLTTPVTNLSPGESDQTLDLGLIRPASLGDYVWYDTNGDGIQSGSETGVAGVTATLTDGSGDPVVDIFGSPVNPVNTNALGFYQFVNLPPGDYTVTFTNLPSGYVPTQTGAGTDIGLDSDGLEISTSLVDGQNDPTLDLGIVQPASVGDFVWFDNIHNGVQDGGEPGAPNVTVTLTDPLGNEVLDINGDPVLPQQTGANGGYLFINLQPGDYIVTFTNLPAGYVPSFLNTGGNDAVDSDGLIVPVNLSSGEQDLSIDLGLSQSPPLVSIGDFVWIDVNRNGQQDSGEPAVADGMVVELYAANGTTLLDSEMTVGGYYAFTSLDPATTYVVKFVKPTSFAFTTQDSGADPTDSDADIVTGKVTVVSPLFGSNSSMPNSADNSTFDAGLVQVDLALAKVRTTVGPFYEGSTVVFTLTPSNDGLADALAGWKVTDILPTGLTAVSIAGSGGPSTYTCVLLTLTCTSSAILPAGGSAETIIVTVTIDANFVGTARNVAYVSPAPTEVSEVNPLVTPDTTTDTSSTPTNNDAQAFVPSGSLVSVGDRVWNDTNRDGVQSFGEAGVVGVTVNLYAADGTTLIKSTITTAGGFYSFDDLVPGTSYVIEFVAPANNAFTTANASGSTAVNDSNADVVTGRATVIAPASGVNSLVTPDEPTIDAGLVNVDLALSKVLTTSPNFFPGKTVSYTLTPSNAGSTDALAGWKITEVLPSQLTLVSMVGSDGGAGIYTCVVDVCTSSAPLAAGGTAETIIVTATINANISGVVHNVAYISPASTEVTEANPLGTPPTTNSDTSGTPTNNDSQADLSSDIYDLASAKTSIVTGTGEDTVIDFEITIANQGTVDSGTYTVVDLVPVGLVVDVSSITNGGVHDAVAGTITWSLSGLIVDATRTVSWSASVGDFSKRPFRNFAEIATDGGASWGGDNDSTPDTDITNDGDYDDEGVDNGTIDDAGNGTDPEDDADIADVQVELTYDLALVKVPNLTSITPSGAVTFTLTVENQGDVNSGSYIVTDTLPVGTAATAASDGGVINGSTVTWNLSNLAAGESRSVTVTVGITDVSKRPFKNIAEISADGADVYDAPVKGGNVEDVDSIPDAVTTNDNGDVDGDGYGTWDNPTNDLLNIADDSENGEDDADVAFFDAPVLYDLALIKTGPGTIDGAGTATFTIEVKNQGNVGSGNFTVTDSVPVGLMATSASNGGVIAGQIVTWNLSGLAAGATTSVTVTVKVADFSKRPWVNIAEISADGASSYDTEGYENPVDGVVTDDDSTPDTNPANDVVVDQTALPAAQQNDANVDEDDHDVAALDALIRYDLALVKNLPGGQSFKKDSNITFNILIKNQGNVNSGGYSVQDVVPAGLTFVSATDNPLVAGQTVTWDLASMAPGEIKSITIVVRIVDVTLGSYVNFGEIVTDGADVYDLPGKDVEDKDSTPDGNVFNDPVADNDDVNIDNLPGDEDDHDRSILDPAQVRSDNPAPPPVAPLPATGGNSLLLLYGAAGLLGIGALALAATRRRRRPV